MPSKSVQQWAPEPDDELQLLQPVVPPQAKGSLMNQPSLKEDDSSQKKIKEYKQSRRNKEVYRHSSNH